ncbi:MAG: phage tail tape measure protein [Lentisphaeraceae bacterium]|nr:phage tail tape measure protein [Lentisphaeraceae bacterium]
MSTNLALTMTVGAAIGASFNQVISTVTNSAQQVGSALALTRKDINIVDSILVTQERLSELQKQKSTNTQRELEIKRQIAEVESKIEALKGKRGQGNIRARHQMNLKSLKSQLKEHNKINTSVDKESAKLQKLTADYAKQGHSVASIQQHHSKLNRTLVTQQRHMTRLNTLSAESAKRKEIQGRALGLVAAGAGAAGTVGSAIEVDRAQTKLKTALSGDDFEKFRQEALRQSQDGIISQEEVFNIQYSLKSAGFDQDAALFGSGLVGKIAKATDGQAGQVGSVLGVIYNNIGDKVAGDTQGKLERIGDLLTKTQLQFQINDFGQLGEGFAQGAAAAITYGLSVEESAAASGAFNSAGKQGSSAGTALNTVLRQLGPASKKFGFEIARSTDGSVLFQKTLENLNDSMQDLKKSEKEELVKKAFGDEGGAVNLLIKDMGKLRKQFKAVNEDSEGAVNEAFNIHLASMSGKFDQLKNSVMNNVVAFGQSLFPVMNSVVAVAKPLLDYTTDFINENKVLVGVVGGVGAALLTGIIAVTAMTYAVSVGVTVWQTGALVLGFFTGANTAFNLAMAKTAIMTKLATAGTWLFNSALLANPITWIVVGVIALIGSLYLLYNKFELVRIIVRAAFWPFLYVYNLITDLGGLLYEFGSLIITALKPIGSAILSYFLDPWKMAFGWIFEKYEKIKGVFSSVAGFFGLRDEDQPGAVVASQSSSKNRGNPDDSAVVMKAAQTAASVTSSKVYAPKTEQTFTIQATPGMDEELLAQKVAELVEEKDRENERRHRGIVGDI